MTKQQKKEVRRKFSQAMVVREAGGKDLRKKIQNTSHQERYDAWNEKRAYGLDTRWILLAYGFVKGIPYKAIEAKTGERNEAYAFAICEASKEATGLTLNGNAVVAWLDGLPVTEEVLETPDVPAEPAKAEPSVVASPPQPEAKTGFVAGLKRLFGVAS